ncbi:SWIM zinc finger family protein [Curvibacter soli]|uniref:SWIM zinc finger family protein n=1 Tax=Curvibacter soli TaxID=3031331 RepID=UPI003AF129BE
MASMGFASWVRAPCTCRFQDNRGHENTVAEAGRRGVPACCSCRVWQLSGLRGRGLQEGDPLPAGRGQRPREGLRCRADGAAQPGLPHRGQRWAVRPCPEALPAR